VRFFRYISRIILLPRPEIVTAFVLKTAAAFLFFSRGTPNIEEGVLKMIKDSLVKALNDQLNAEYYSAYLYLTMSAYADRLGYKGIANWLLVQAKEETAHGTHIYQHLLERGAVPAFQDIKAPQVSYGSLKEVFERVLVHERQVTEQISQIASLALNEKDHITYNFILWYVNEQVEEEANAEDLVVRFNRIGDNPGLLYPIDAQLGTRRFTNPFPETGT
jgi:ferritin